MSKTLSELNTELIENNELLISVLAKRSKIVDQIGTLKTLHNLPPFNTVEDELGSKIFIQAGGKNNLEKSFLRKIWRTVSHHDLKKQIKLLGSLYLLQKLEEKKLKIQNKISKKKKK